MIITHTEYNTCTNTAELWNYVFDGAQLKSSYLLMSVPVPSWGDRNVIMNGLVCYALDTGKWEFGRD